MTPVKASIAGKASGEVHRRAVRPVQLNEPVVDAGPAAVGVLIGEKRISNQLLGFLSAGWRPEVVGDLVPPAERPELITAPRTRGPHEGEADLKSSHWKIPLESPLSFEERRAEADRITSQWSRDFDEMGAPPE